MTSTLQLHFPTYIYTADHPLGTNDHNMVVNAADEIKKDIVEKPSNWFCDVLTSYNRTNLIQHEPFHLLLDVLIGHVRSFCDHLGAEVNYVGVDHAWINCSTKGQYQEQHTHPNSSISAIYYLKAPDGSAGTVFKAPHQKHNRLPIKKYTDITRTEVVIPAETGKLILFESDIPHLTQKHTLEEERMTFAANFTVR